MNYKRMIEDMIDEIDNFTNEWEQEFVQSINDQVNEGRDLSGKQKDKLEDIYKDFIKRTDK